jgi:hypothetical protein
MDSQREVTSGVLVKNGTFRDILGHGQDRAGAAREIFAFLGWECAEVNAMSQGSAKLKNGKLWEIVRCARTAGAVGGVKFLEFRPL